VVDDQHVLLLQLGEQHVRAAGLLLLLAVLLEQRR
jgi:hypothetical protein